MTLQTIRVELGANEAQRRTDKSSDKSSDKSYDIHVGQGLMARAGALIRPLLHRPHVAIITDEQVAQHHLNPLQTALDAAGITHRHKILPSGEATKSFAHLEDVCDWLLAEKIERQDMIIALGGGVIGDLTGFAASILRRGVGFIQIPTTLLAQVDSSVGGKTAINAKQGKNLIGAFHQPKLVIADIDTLKTLPPREMKAGYAEVVKYAALGGLGKTGAGNADFFNWLDDNVQSLMQGDAATLITAITKSCRMKADIVSQDERENGVRALLNLGHTFGHAYEALTNYSDALRHGEAVGIGLVMAFQLSANLGHLAPTDVVRLEKHLQKAGMMTSPKQIKNASFNIEALMEAMAQDKKVTDGVMTFILVRAIGDAFITSDVSAADVRAVLVASEKTGAEIDEAG